MTPLEVARTMCGLITQPPSEWRVLDPGCGDGNLLLAARLAGAALPQPVAPELLGLDIDPAMVAAANLKLPPSRPGSAIARCGDFTQEAASLIEEFSPTVILANPPYGSGREYEFFQMANDLAPAGCELIFLVPLAFIDRVSADHVEPLPGRPLGVTTGHAIVRHRAGRKLEVRRIKENQQNQSSFEVFNGIKLYEVGAGSPEQSSELVRAKPYSSSEPVDGWRPCARTGDVHPFDLRPPRMWVHYGEHLARPKAPHVFVGPRLFVRRVPIWARRQLGAAFTSGEALCAGDVLVVRHKEDDEVMLRGLEAWLNSPEPAESVLRHRPSVRHRDSFPKIAGKDLNRLFDEDLPSDGQLRRLAARRAQVV